MTRVAERFNSVIEAVGAVMGIVVGLSALLYALVVSFDDGEVANASGSVVRVTEHRGSVSFRLAGHPKPYAISMKGQDRRRVIAALRDAPSLSVHVAYRPVPSKPWFSDEEHYPVSRVEVAGGVVIEQEIEQSERTERIGLVVFGAFALVCSGLAFARLSSANASHA